MHKIYDIRGTHGSGKSSVVRHILDTYESTPIHGLPLTYEGRLGVLGYYIPALNLTILGKYETACGGCDGIKTQDEIKARVNHYSKDSNVLLEGILVAHTFVPWLHFSEGKNWVFCFLDTPLEECIARVDARRAKAGKGPLPDTKNVVRDHGRIWAMYDKFADHGREVRWISGPVDFLEVFNE